MIRIAQPADLDDLMGLLIRFHSENGEAPLNLKKTRAEIERLIDFDRVFVIDDEGMILGAIGIDEVEPWYSDQTELVDRFLYVVPDRRKDGLGALLVRAATIEAEVRKKPLTITVSNRERAGRRGRIGILARYGFEPFGYTVKATKCAEPANEAPPPQKKKTRSTKVFAE